MIKKKIKVGKVEKPVKEDLGLGTLEISDKPISVPNNKIIAEKSEPKKHGWLIMLICGIIALGAGAACVIIALMMPTEEPIGLKFPGIKFDGKGGKYSLLTGDAVDDSFQLNAPVYCVQTPNGMDGARPQAGLNEAGVIFEAIAEAGITRFAAIYQNPSAAVIGPIRSLRIYYLQWDTPFDCTIVHAGGADDAIAAVRSGGYRDLTENYTYMYRGSSGVRRWNNLFTTGSLLRSFNENNGYTTSDIKGFSRLTPEESKLSRVNNLAKEKLVITKPSSGDTSELVPKTTNILIRFGGISSFNVKYQYDAATNSYFRSYENDVAHEVYKCPAEDKGEKDPEDICELQQLSPSVVIAMAVREGKASDGYHEDITTVGSGEAYIFQNGEAIKGTWQKDSIDSQIRFKDEAGQEIKLAPGQTIISAIPAYGSIEF